MTGKLKGKKTDKNSTNLLEMKRKNTRVITTEVESAMLVVFKNLELKMK